MSDVVVVMDRKKPKINLSLLPELHEQWEKSTAFLGEKRKWQASSAAVYLWLKLSDSERQALAERMYAADGGEQARQKLVAEFSPPIPKGRNRLSNPGTPMRAMTIRESGTRPT